MGDRGGEGNGIGVGIRDGYGRGRMSAGGLLRFVLMRHWLNLKAGFEYRASFWSQVLFMMANNSFLLWFWQIFFAHFGNVRGWHASDMYLLYGLSATSFGLANVFAGNSIDLAAAVSDGDLDYFISLPPPTLLHVLVTKLRVSAIGDLAFGVIVLALYSHGSLARFGLSLAVCVPAAMIFTSVAVLGASLAFFLGESRGITFQLVNLLLTFSTYPEAIFQGSMRWVIYVLIPAGFFAHIPARAMHDVVAGALAWDILKLLGGAGAFGAAAVWLFYRGLRRYSSGSAVSIRI